MTLQFFVCYRRTGAEAEKAIHPLESRLRWIAVHYLRGWFAADALSIVSSVFDVVPIIVSASSGVHDDGSSAAQRDGGKGFVSTLRIVRAFRLVKLVRLVRASRIIRRLEVRQARPTATITLISLVVQVLLSSHLIACLLGMLVTVFAHTPLVTWQATYGYCRPDDAHTPPPSSTSTPALQSETHTPYECADHAFLYMQSLYWAIGVIAGYATEPLSGPYEPFLSPEHPTGTSLRVGEQVVQLLMLIFGAFQWTCVPSSPHHMPTP
jgi:hypothetical protein